MSVTTIRLPASNVHVVTGPGGTVLVDAGTRAAVPPGSPTPTATCASCTH